MPIRLTCPSCSATLSIKDEFAGRAVKCPKCGGVIPASQPAAPPPAAPVAAAPPPPRPAPPPPPPPEPEPEPFDALDEPAPAKGGKIVGKPSSRARDEDDEDDRPVKRKRRDEDEDDAPRGKKGARAGKDDADEDDRPAKRKRRDEDADADRPARRRRDADDRDEEPRRKSKLPIILAVVGFGMLSCCGAGGYGVYYLYEKGMEAGAEELAAALNEKNDKLTPANVAKLQEMMTQAQVEEILGKGQVPNARNFAAAYKGNKERAAEWTKRASTGRVLMWRNQGDHLFVAFHDKPEAGGKMQLREFVPKSGTIEWAGEPDDAKFAKIHNLAADDTPAGPPVEVTAEDICKSYKDEEAAADAKYKDKIVRIEGKLEAIDLMADGSVYARLLGVGIGGAGGLQARCVVQKGDINKVWGTSRGQTIKLRGKCAGKVAIFVDVMNCKYESNGPDPSLAVTAADLIKEVGRNAETADEKYKEKAVTITNAVVESKKDDSIVLVGEGKVKSTVKIKATWPFDFKKLFADIKPGQTITIKGEYGSAFNGVISINGVWLVPK